MPMEYEIRKLLGIVHSRLAVDQMELLVVVDLGPMVFQFVEFELKVLSILMADYPTQSHL